ncbi:hypothetical protein UFOVP4_19 [uncultured Caudovirales phage]|uniref:Uncharacterized protein n=1 Tax=uncultured Caudovirales phage TaxID=2100421 RepID=A0A6J7VKS4_9CAUD|nr:hypothetical protein UFOVP4_19 [uncultured Caudovirales phage]CAB4241312.1 hypothetical protein UFOVP64_40 [uncultured Caudovirales phage]CAB5079013.1 hypothetical protein UFOVP145_54 [uncultured Caudovirales phage]
MHIIAYTYPLLDVCVVTLAPQEQYTFAQKAASASWGFFGLGGYTDMIDGAPRGIGRRFESEGQWHPNDEDNGWSNDFIGHADETVLAGPNGSKWLCLSSNGHGDLEVTHLLVQGDATIPAGSGFVVATGEVVFEGKTARQFAYAKPRDADFTVVGGADILLVR